MPKATLIILITVAVVGTAIYAVYRFRTRKKRREKRRKRRTKEKVVSLSKNEVELTPQQFMALRAKSFGGDAENLNFAGVYIIFNKTKNKYYVGQGRRVLDRVNMHFTGKGNGDVYADYKYGDKFTIKTVGLKHSGYRSLNALERDTIAVYNAYATGYNKTKGNKN